MNGIDEEKYTLDSDVNMKKKIEIILVCSLFKAFF